MSQGRLRTAPRGPRRRFAFARDVVMASLHIAAAKSPPSSIPSSRLKPPSDFASASADPPHSPVPLRKPDSSDATPSAFCRTFALRIRPRTSCARSRILPAAQAHYYYLSDAETE